MKRPIGKNIFILVLWISLQMSVSGCFYLVLGGAAAVGGYAISPDTLQGDTDKDFERLWSAAVDIVSIMGTINSQSHELGKISAIVNGCHVTIHVIQLTPSSVRLKVKAKKAGLPSIANAENIFVKIMENIRR